MHDSRFSNEGKNIFFPEFELFFEPKVEWQGRGARLGGTPGVEPLLLP